MAVPYARPAVKWLSLLLFATGFILTIHTKANARNVVTNMKIMVFLLISELRLSVTQCVRVFSPGLILSSL